MDFLNEMGKRFSNVARTVSEKNRDGAEANRLAEELHAAEAELEKLYAGYGRACYVLRLGGGDRAAADDWVARIRALTARVEALAAQRESWREPRRCASCGALQPRSARFCSACGKRMADDAPPADPPPEMGPFCPACGAAIGPGEKRCAVCGALTEEAGGAPAPDFEPDAALLARIDVEEPAPGEAEDF